MPRSKRQTTVLLIALTCLSGCGTAAVYNCPPLKTYPPAFSKGLAGELETAGPPTVEAISDDPLLRRPVAACAKP